MNHLTITLGDFLRRIAIDYVRFGYHRYVIREIPQGKDLGVTDQKLIDSYRVTTHRMKRLRLRRKGHAVVQYLRFGHTFVLLATDGEHEAFDRLRSYHIKTAPLHIASYSIGLVGNTVTVRVAKDVWSEIETRVLAIALKKKDYLEHAIESLPYYRFPGVTRQKQSLVTQVNQQRKAAGLSLIKPLLLSLRSQHRGTTKTLIVNNSP